MPARTARALLLALSFVSAARAQPAGPEGVWLDETGRAAIRIGPCGDGTLCGRVVWLRMPLDETGHPKRDIHNDDEALRNRPLCGLTILGGFRPGMRDGEWDDGRIYDPENGGLYHATMRMRPDGTMRVRGYIGITLLGRSQIWTRANPVPPPCKQS